MDQTPDQQLIALLQLVGSVATVAVGEREEAFRRLYELTSPKLFGVAVRVLGNREWAEDVLQDAYLQVWRSAANYSQSLSPPGAWMGVIVRSRALDFLRRRRAEHLDTALEFDEALHETLAGAAESPMAAGQASQEASALQECLRKLQPQQRELVCLAYLRDLSHSELAQQLKIPIGTVKTWIRRGIEQLRGCMAHYA